MPWITLCKTNEKGEPQGPILVNTDSACFCEPPLESQAITEIRFVDGSRRWVSELLTEIEDMAKAKSG
jgi:hypothetical protein